MPTLPSKYEDRFLKSFAFHAVWLPGTPLRPGSIVDLAGGVFRPVAHVEDFGVEVETEPGLTFDLSLQTQNARVVRVDLAAGVEVPQWADLEAEGELRIEFSSQNQFVLNSEPARATLLKKGPMVAAKLAQVPTWRFGEWHVVSEVLSTSGFTFFGKYEGKGAVVARGKARALEGALRGQAGVELGYSGTIDYAIVGQADPGQTTALGIRTFRLAKNGNQIPT